jgi:hypothetical protein
MTVCAMVVLLAAASTSGSGRAEPADCIGKPALMSADLRADASLQAPMIRLEYVLALLAAAFAGAAVLGQRMLDRSAARAAGRADDMLAGEILPPATVHGPPAPDAPTTICADACGGAATPSSDPGADQDVEARLLRLLHEWQRIAP